MAHPMIIYEDMKGLRALHNSLRFLSLVHRCVAENVVNQN
jgi:hypothetical protein